MNAPNPQPTSPSPIDLPRATNSAGAPHWRRHLGLLLAGQIVSHLGDALFLSVIFFVAMDVTGSKATSGVLSGMNFLPALVLGLFAGALVDRTDRRRVMIAADLVRAVAVASIPALHAFGALGGATLGVAVFVLAAGSTLFNPAFKALVPQIAPGTHLVRAASAFQVAEYAALVAGPFVASLAIPRVGTMPLLAIDAATFLASALFVALLPAVGPWPRPVPAAPRLRVITDAFAGAREVLTIPVVRILLVIGTLNNLAIMGLAHVGVPLLIMETLGLGADAYARTLKYFFLGMALSSALFWGPGRRLAKGPAILIGIILDGLTFVPFAFCRTVDDVALAQLVHGVFIPLIIIPRTVLIQQVVPPALHGRAFALVNVTVFGMMALSNPIVGALAEVVAPPALFVVLGILGAVPGVVGFAIPGLRKAR